LNRLFTPAGYAAAGLVVLLAVLAAWWIVIGGPAADRRGAVEARAGRTVAEGAAAAAGDAQAVVINNSRAESAVDRQTLENRDAILTQPNARLGAGAAGDAGLRGLCGRAAYRDVERCRQLLAPGP